MSSFYHITAQWMQSQWNWTALRVGREPSGDASVVPVFIMSQASSLFSSPQSSTSCCPADQFGEQPVAWCPCFPHWAGVRLLNRQLPGPSFTCCAARFFKCLALFRGKKAGEQTDAMGMPHPDTHTTSHQILLSAPMVQTKETGCSPTIPSQSTMALWCSLNLFWSALTLK